MANLLKSFGLIVFGMSSLSAGAQQTAPTPSFGAASKDAQRAVTAEDPASKPDDIVVQGLRDLNEPAPLVDTKTQNSVRADPDSIHSRQSYDSAERFARCAIKPDLHNMRLLHLTLDSTMNSVRQDNAQRRFVTMHLPCATDTSAATQKGLTIEPRDSTDAEMQFYYDRGAMFVRAVQVFAPHISLSKTQLADPAVKARFVAREQKLVRFRLPQDRQYFSFAICLVSNQPERSIRLVTANLPYLARRDLTADIVNGSRGCFGRARHVYFDPIQMRFYLADALYRWIIAVHGDGSLIPQLDGPSD